MDGLEDEKLFQMVCDFLESESPSENLISCSQKLPSSDHYYKHCILKDIVESRIAAEDEVLGSVLRSMSNKMSPQNNSSLKKWLVRSLRKNGYKGASLCQTSWSTIPACPAGKYEFIEVVIEAMNNSTSRLILDIDFKSQFEIARPTSSYEELSDNLPSIFIGDVHKLTKIISIMCSEGKLSFKERGLHIPPWRTTTYMKSKWFSNPRLIPLNATKEVGQGRAESQLVGEHFSSKFNQPTALAPLV